MGAFVTRLDRIEFGYPVDREIGKRERERLKPGTAGNWECPLIIFTRLFLL